MAKMHIKLSVNNRNIEILVEPRLLLIHLLREELGITGPHIGCDTSHCGACTVDMNGKSVKSCTVFAVQASGAQITTVEGLAGADGSLHPLHPRLSAVGGEPEPERGGNPSRNFGKFVPMHRLSDDRQGHSRRRGADE